MSEEKPPLFQSWKTWYWLVFGAMIVQVILFFWISKSFA
jgi:hypothetical protein